MRNTTEWRSAVATHAGRVRADNQDRVWADNERGLFLVVDGLGGHAAGDKAAEIAVATIRAEMASSGEQSRLRDRIEAAITAANNRIFESAEQDQNLSGMACVLTLASIADDKVVVGHVGDSRLYLVWNGAIRKITSDHSPVGEREDAGELTESEAMVHPRRNEVFRDVGSRRREPDEEDFIEIKEFLFKSDAAVLLCSDGLSDLLTSSEILDIIERYNGDAETVTRELIEGANAAGGVDNVSAIFIAGPEFLGNSSPAAAEARARNAITKARDDTSAHLEGSVSTRVPAKLGNLLTCRVAFLIYGFVLGTALAVLLHWPKP
jgi:PPM family protein phosphatase